MDSTWTLLAFLFKRKAKFFSILFRNNQIRSEMAKIFHHFFLLWSYQLWFMTRQWNFPYETPTINVKPFTNTVSFHSHCYRLSFPKCYSKPFKKVLFSSLFKIPWWVCVFVGVWVCGCVGVWVCGGVCVCGCGVCVFFVQYVLYRSVFASFRFECIWYARWKENEWESGLCRW